MNFQYSRINRYLLEEKLTLRIKKRQNYTSASYKYSSGRFLRDLRASISLLDTDVE